MNSTRLLTHTQNLSQTRWHDAQSPALQAGQVRVAIERFALTANNITYAAMGQAMNYWQFFPTGQEGWGCVPVWGFGRVVQSLHSGVAVGERLWGYWPLGRDVVLTPAKLSAAQFYDGAPHRRELHSIYNQYSRCAADPLHRDKTQDIEALLRPLFMTAFLIDDFFADNAFFGATHLLLSSASSKTAYATAHCLQARQRGADSAPKVQVLGLTSARNRSFCEGMGCYDRVLTYEELGTLSRELACAYIDFAGSAPLRQQVHQHFTRLCFDSAIGAAHVSELGSAKNLPGPRTQMFFAPAQAKKRADEWGAAVLGQRMAKAWFGFVQRVQSTDNPARAPWLTVQTHTGPSGAEQAYAQVLGNQGDARLGHMVVW